MKLTKLYFENYKAFAGEHELELRPLTILIGRNNSGKSALARLPELLREIVSNKDTGAACPATDQAEAHKLFHAQPLIGRMKLGWSLDDPKAKLILSYETLRGGSGPISLLSGVQVDEQEVKVKTSYDEPEDTYSARWQIEDPVPGRIMSVRNELNAPLKYQPIHFGLHDDLYEFVNKDNGDIVLEPVGTQEDNDRLRSCNEALKVFTDKIEQLADTASWPKISRFPAVREKPSRGAQARRGSEDFNYYAWSATRIYAMKRENSPVFDALRSWIKTNLGGYDLEVEQSEAGLELLLRHPEHERAVHITNTGAGLGQILPVLIYCLNQREQTRDGAAQRQDRLLIVEEPESHLHPGVHGVLAELFIDFIKAPQHRVMVETHSEVFCLRVQRHVAEGTLRPEDVVIYWVDTKEGVATPTPIFISEKGETYIWRDGKRIRYWPKGVFSEDADEIRALHELQAASR